MSLKYLGFGVFCFRLGLSDPPLGFPAQILSPLPTVNVAVGSSPPVSPAYLPPWPWTPKPWLSCARAPPLLWRRRGLRLTPDFPVLLWIVAKSASHHFETMFETLGSW